MAARLLKYGHQGTDVKELQSSLKKVGYGIADDGKFGRETLSAVAGFQNWWGLGVDGIVGPQTRQGIQDALAGKKPKKKAGKATKASAAPDSWVVEEWYVIELPDEDEYEEWEEYELYAEGWEDLEEDEDEEGDDEDEDEDEEGDDEDEDEDEEGDDEDEDEEGDDEDEEEGEEGDEEEGEEEEGEEGGDDEGGDEGGGEEGGDDDELGRPRPRRGAGLGLPGQRPGEAPVLHRHRGMKRRLLALLGLAALSLGSGCYHFTFEQQARSAPAPAEGALITYREHVPTYLNGFVGNGKLDTARYCAEPVRTELRVTALDVLASVGTLLIYTPHTLYVTCERSPQAASR